VLSVLRVALARADTEPVLPLSSWPGASAGLRSVSACACAPACHCQACARAFPCGPRPNINAPVKHSGALRAPMVTLQIVGGRKEKIRPGDVLGALTNEEGGPAYTREQIGKIQVTEFCTFVAVAREIAPGACAKLNAGRIKGKSVKVRLM
jgi:hypothetical protein